jgi:putative endonuclease
MTYDVYILASRPNGTLYNGVISDLVRRIQEHREGLADGFTRRHGVKQVHDHIDQAIQREKTLKHWPRAWKIALIARENPPWTDLWNGLSG